MEVRPGDIAGILGPATHGPKQAQFYVLIRDETALPDIARILQSLPAIAIGHAFIEIDMKIDELTLFHKAGLSIRWLHCNGARAGTTTLLEDVLRSVQCLKTTTRPSCSGCEHRKILSIYWHLKQDIGLPRDRFVLYLHWHRSLSEEEIIASGAEAYLPQ